MKSPFRSSHVLLIAVALGAIAGCGLLKRAVVRPTVTYERMAVREMSFQDATVDLFFAVYNPNPFGIPLKGYDYAFKIGDETVVTGNQALSFSIPAKGRGELTVPVTVRFEDVMAAIRLLRDEDLWPYSVAGSVTIDTGPLAGITIPFSHQDTLPRPMPPKISIDHIRVGSMSLTSITMDVMLRLRNPGKIAYTISGLAGSIELNGRRFAEIGRISEVIRLDSDGSQTITVPIRLSALQMVRGLQSMVQAGEANYRFVGEAGIGADRFDISLPLSIDEAGTVPLFR